MSALALSLKLSAIKTLSAVQRAINILKSAGPGAWYDPSDLTTLFQDSAGTTPVTAVEQPVGLVLDKSKGLVLGGELVASQDLSTWTSAGAFGNWGTSTSTASTLTSTGISGSRYVKFACAPGATITASATGNMAGIATGARLAIAFGTSGNALISIFDTLTTSASPVQLRVVGTAPSNAAFCEIIVRADGASGSQATFTAISAKQLPGNHLIQPTATSRPTLSSRYNLLTKTEQFDDAGWGKSGTAVTANAAIAPDGTVTADLLIASAASGVHALSQAATVSVGACTFSIRAKAAGYNWATISMDGTAFVFFDLSTGQLGSVGAGHTGAIRPDGNGYYICEATFTHTAGLKTHYVNVASANNVFSFLGDGTSGIHIWGASLTTAADASLPYQRVNTATDYDYDFSKFPPFLRMDGIDDSLYTAASIDFTSTDKMTVFAGVHKVGITSGAVLETSATSDTNNGSFSYFTGAWSDARDYFSTRGTVLSYPSLSVTPPVTYVIAAASNISGDLITVRSNSVQVVNSSADLGTGNFGNYPLYIGRRNNASLPFNGRLYQLAIKGKALSAAEISTVESYINSKTKAY